MDFTLGVIKLSEEFKIYEVFSCDNIIHEDQLREFKTKEGYSLLLISEFSSEC